MQSRYSWKYRRTGYVRFSSLGQYKMSDCWVYDLKSCRSYMIRLVLGRAYRDLTGGFLLLRNFSVD